MPWSGPRDGQHPADSSTYCAARVGAKRPAPRCSVAQTETKEGAVSGPGFRSQWKARPSLDAGPGSSRLRGQCGLRRRSHLHKEVNETP